MPGRSHTRVLRVIAAIAEEPSGVPFLAKFKTNRSTPAEPGQKLEAVGKHTVRNPSRWRLCVP